MVIRPKIHRKAGTKGGCLQQVQVTSMTTQQLLCEDIMEMRNTKRMAIFKSVGMT